MSTIIGNISKGVKLFCLIFHVHIQRSGISFFFAIVTTWPAYIRVAIVQSAGLKRACKAKVALKAEGLFFIVESAS